MIITGPSSDGGRDPATFALEAVGATGVLADEIEMWAWDAGAHRLEVTRPFRGRQEMFRAYELPPRRVAYGATTHSWSYGTRLGPCATGQWGNMAEGSKRPPVPPALRKVNWREFLQILQASQQVGLPRSVHADASFGWPFYCYQSY